MAKPTKHWLNIAKLFAIMAVVVNHCSGWLYSDGKIEVMSYFSVSLFTLLGGITSFYSCDRHKSECGAKETWRRMSGIIIPYVFAVAIYTFAKNHILDFSTYLNELLSFKISGPFYFVLFWLQLVIVAPLLYDVLIFTTSREKRMNGGGSVIVVYLLLLLFVYLQIRFLPVFPVCGGSAYLLGGTYLLLFFAGMHFASLDIKIKSGKLNIVLIIVFFIASMKWGWFVANDYFKLDTHFPFGRGINPPGVSLIIYALFVFCLIFTLFSLLEKSENIIVKKCIYILSKLGSCSLYIFLYHMLVLQVFKENNWFFEDISVRRFGYFGGMLLIPCAIKFSLDFAKEYYNKIIKVE
jgi:hypothetical protein